LSKRTTLPISCCSIGQDRSGIELDTIGIEKRGLDHLPFLRLNSNSRSGIDAIRPKNAAPPMISWLEMRNPRFNLGRLKALMEKSQIRRLVPQQKDAIADAAS
jgi:hypothetical protein